MDKLKPRFAGHNGRSSADEWRFYSDILELPILEECEKRKRRSRADQRTQNKEIRVKKDLRRYVEWITQHYEDEIEKFNAELDMSFLI
jgi:hypothetical protein